MAWHGMDCCALQEESMRLYVQQQLEYGRFWKILEFSEKVDKLLEVRGQNRRMCSVPEYMRTV